MSTMMERAGLSRLRQLAAERRGRWMEEIVAVLYGGTLRPMFDPVGDVDLPSGLVIDVKSVPREDSKFVNAGAKRPVSLALVLSEEPVRLLAAVEPSLWHSGVPAVHVMVDLQPCWHVLRSEVALPPLGWMVAPGFVEPSLYWRTVDEALRADWRDRNRRKRERAANRPLPLPGIGVDDPRGVGLASRRGHAPGKTNHIRRRP